MARADEGRIDPQQRLMFKIISKKDGEDVQLVTVIGDTNLSPEQILKRHGHDPESLDWAVES